MANSPNNADRGGLIRGVSLGTIIPAIIVVIARVFARTYRGAFGFDDACIVISTAVSVCGLVFTEMQLQVGFGKHAQYLTSENAAAIVHWLLAGEMQAAIGVMITKVSVCWFVLRLLGPTHRWMHVVIWADIACMFITTAVYAFSQGFVCIPLRAYWDPSVHGRCITRATIGRIVLATNSLVMDIITDFVCAALPLSLIHGLKMNRQAKMMFGTLVGLGFLTAATSIAKTVTVELYATDPSWTLTEPAFWVILEQNASIVIASLPSLRLFVSICQKYKSSRKLCSEDRDGDSARRLNGNEHLMLRVDYSYHCAIAVGSDREDSVIDLAQGNVVGKENCRRKYGHDVFK